MNEYTKIQSYEEYEQKIKDYETQLKLMCDTQRPHNVLIVSGDPGIGKSYRAGQIMSNQTNVKCVVREGTISAVEFYRLMWQNNDSIIVLDDVNNIIKDSNEGASLLKACTESKPLRQLHWQKRNPNCVSVSKFKCDNNIKIAERMNIIVNSSGRKTLMAAHDAGLTFPDTFYFTGAVIILTNKSLKCLDRATEGAVSNRGAHMQLSFSVEGAIDFIKKFGPTMHEFNGNTISDEVMKETIEFMTSNEAIKHYVDNCKIPTLRNLGRIAVQHKKGVPFSESLLENNTESSYSY